MDRFWKDMIVMEVPILYENDISSKSTYLIQHFSKSIQLGNKTKRPKFFSHFLLRCNLTNLMHSDPRKAFLKTGSGADLPEKRIF